MAERAPAARSAGAVAAAEATLLLLGKVSIRLWTDEAPAATPVEAKCEAAAPGLETSAEPF